MKPALTEAAEKLISWVKYAALPLWRKQGVDSVLGGGYERLLGDGSPDKLANRHMRSQAQLAYVLARADQQGWLSGCDTLTKSISYFVARHGTLPCRSDGYVRSLSAELSIIDDAHDLSDHAYFILSSVAAYSSFGDGSDIRRAYNIVEWLNLKLAHEEGGWYEGTYPLKYRKSSSHLTMFMAFLYLAEVTNKPQWRQCAGEVLQLFQEKFFDADGGFIWTCYEDDWSRPQSECGTWVDSGLLSRWACLIQRYETMMGGERTDTAEKLLQAAVRMADPNCRVLTWSAVDQAGGSISSVTNCAALMDLIRASLGMLTTGTHVKNAGFYEALAVEAIEAFFTHFVADNVRGLCFDQLDENLHSTSDTHKACTLFFVFEAALASHQWIKQNSVR